MQSEFDKLSPPAQEELRDLDLNKAESLAFGARCKREKTKEMSYPQDPLQALQEAREVRSEPIVVEVFDPVALALSVMQITTMSLENRDFDTHYAKPLAEVINVAEYALRRWHEQDNECADRIRAILHPTK